MNLQGEEKFHKDIFFFLFERMKNPNLPRFGVLFKFLYFGQSSIGISIHSSVAACRTTNTKGVSSNLKYSTKKIHELVPGFESGNP